ncbi:hypothetical protein CEXT_661151 [Caerostris extrusa]|uniref:Uncharacterized protein n=1 Tax=Caerostris extrusa TaxID=172846 RepID=A0AAV4S810_CAEEX|nr:hypothetical protein CEXT_661151 [Caerostris extrusa]
MVRLLTQKRNSGALKSTQRKRALRPTPCPTSNPKDHPNQKFVKRIRKWVHVHRRSKVRLLQKHGLIKDQPPPLHILQQNIPNRLWK